MNVKILDVKIQDVSFCQTNFLMKNRAFSELAVVVCVAILGIFCCCHGEPANVLPKGAGGSIGRKWIYPIVGRARFGRLE